MKLKIIIFLDKNFLWWFKLSIEDQKNRDLFLKICFMYFLIHILNVLDIKEEIDDVLPTELVSMNNDGEFKIFDDLHDFRVITKSGLIIIFEFKKNMIRTDDLKQVYNYFKRLDCKCENDIIAIIIVISKEGRIKAYDIHDVTYHPRIIKTKKINKQQDLKIIRNKLKDNIILTSMECSLLITFPLFDLEETEAEIVEEMCYYIKYKNHCIPDDLLDGIILGMYLNILEYVDIDKQDELKEMIDVVTKSEGVIAGLINKGKEQGIEQGIEQGEKNIILDLLKVYTIEEISSIINKDEAEIRKIIE